MPQFARELFRILKPNGQLICGMELERLRWLESYGVISADQYDPLRYLNSLEAAGFKNIKVCAFI